MMTFDRMRADLAKAYDLQPSPQATKATADRYAHVARVIPPEVWAQHAPYIVAIDQLKRDRNAVILGHNYMPPHIFHGVSDVVGDSLQLAIKATEVRADVIVQAGVHFMAETSKILNPAKTVLIPDLGAGCSLAESITPAGVEQMRARYPGAQVVSYVNTSAAVKAASDVCCTSANAAQIVAAMPGDTVIMTPDKYLAQNVARQVPGKRVVWWDGACMVHEQFTAEQVREARDCLPGVMVIAHPECPPEVLAEADFSGSTSAMMEIVRSRRPERVMLVTECSMAANMASDLPEVEFAGSCILCPHMQKITLENILWALHTMTHEVTVAPDVAEPARRTVQRMIDLSRQAAR